MIENLEETNIKNNVTVLGITGSYGPSGSQQPEGFYKCVSVAVQPSIVSPQDALSSEGTGYSISASSEYSSGYAAWKAFDGSSGQDNGWFSLNDATPWIQIQFSTPTVINFYSFCAAYDSGNQSLAEWTLQGSNDGNTWDNLDHKSEQNISGNTAFSGTFSNTTAYAYYRLSFPSTFGYSYIGVQQLQFGTYNKSWTGYKAVMVNGEYSEYETTVTTGLQYGNAFTPEVGKIYNDGATAVVTLNSTILYAFLDQTLDINGGGSMTSVGTISYFVGKSTEYAASVSTDNYIKTGVTTADIQGDFTIDFWVKLTESYTRYGVIAAESDLRLGIDTFDGKWNIWAGSNGESWDILQSDEPYQENSGNGSIQCTTEWTHIAFVRSGNNWYLFVNGQLSVHKVRSGTLYSASGAEICLGRWGDAAYSNGTFLIERMRISNKALWTSAFTPPN